jgi:hypothetical protein
MIDTGSRSFAPEKRCVFQLAKHLLAFLAQIAQYLIYHVTYNIIRDLRNKPILSHISITGEISILQSQPVSKQHFSPFDFTMCNDGYSGKENSRHLICTSLNCLIHIAKYRFFHSCDTKIFVSMIQIFMYPIQIRMCQFQIPLYL